MNSVTLILLIKIYFELILFRKLALSLCEWDVTDEGLKERLDRLVQNNEVERAAALALFHNKLDWTIEYLSSGQQIAQKKGWYNRVVVVIVVTVALLVISFSSLCSSYIFHIQFRFTDRSNGIVRI